MGLTLLGKADVIMIGRPPLSHFIHGTSFSCLLNRCVAHIMWPCIPRENLVNATGLPMSKINEAMDITGGNLAVILKPFPDGDDIEMALRTKSRSIYLAVTSTGSATVAVKFLDSLRDSQLMEGGGSQATGTAQAVWNPQTPEEEAIAKELVHGNILRFAYGPEGPAGDQFKFYSWQNLFVLNAYKRFEQTYEEFRRQNQKKWSLF